MAAAEIGLAHEQGATGEVNEPVVTTQQQHVTPKSDIQHVGTRETIMQLLYKNWIYIEALTWTAAQQPGTILGYYPIHPSSCNYVWKHTYKLFNAWTGTMKARLRVLGTAFYGGSLQIGFLPPNVRPDQMQNLSIQYLTANPSEEIDPKSPNWIFYTAPDQRRVMYHMGGLDTTNMDSFGGYIVIYVTGHLVTQDPEFDRVQIRVDLAGDFEPMQPNPNMSESLIVSHPLRDVSHDILAGSMCDTSMDSPFMTLGVYKSTLTDLHSGWFNAGVIGGGFTSNYPRVIVSKPWANTIKALQQGKLIFNNQGHAKARKTQDDPPRCAISTSTVGNKESCMPICMDGDASQIVTYKWNAGDRNYPGIIRTSVLLYATQVQGDSLRNVEAVFNMPGGDEYSWPCNDPDGTGCVIATKNSGTGATLPDPSFQDTADNLADLAGCVLPKRRTDESFVLFVDLNQRTWSIQTTPFRDAVQSFNLVDPNMTYLYSLTAYDDESPIMYLRLWPEGYLTTTASATNFIVRDPNVEGAMVPLRLVFLQPLAASSAMPAPKPTMRQALRDVKNRRYWGH